MARRRQVPLLGQLGRVQCLCRAPRPVGAAGAADGVADGLKQGDEVIQRLLVVAQEAQRDPSGQPFGFGEVRSRLKAVIARDAIGLRNVAIDERAAGQNRPLIPPLVGPGRAFRRPRQHLARRRVPSLAAPPTQSLEDQARIILQVVGNLGDGVLYRRHFLRCA